MTAAPSPRLRLDRSRPFGTIHGDRAPNDPHQRSCFSQEGIHFDAQGLHIDELIEEPKVRALVDRKLKKQIKAAAPDADDDAGGSDDADEPPPPTGGAGAGSTDVNLEAWLRGEVNYPWFQITKTVRERYSQNITKIFDMLEFLVGDAKVIAESELKPEFAQTLKPQG